MAPPDMEALFTGALGGDADAWRQLWQTIEPRLYAILRRPDLLGPASQSERECRAIIVEVERRLRAQGLALLARYRKARQVDPALPFLGWLVVLAKRVAFDRRGEATGAGRDVGDTLPAYGTLAAAGLAPEVRAAVAAWIARGARPADAESAVREGLEHIRRRFTVVAP
jgi:hypothetical protein